MNCPSCHVRRLEQAFVVLKRDTCECGYLMQVRHSPPLPGSLALIEWIVTKVLENGISLELFHEFLVEQTERVRERKEERPCVK